MPSKTRRNSKIKISPARDRKHTRAHARQSSRHPLNFPSQTEVPVDSSYPVIENPNVSSGLELSQSLSVENSNYGVGEPGRVPEFRQHRHHPSVHRIHGTNSGRSLASSLADSLLSRTSSYLAQIPGCPQGLEYLHELPVLVITPEAANFSFQINVNTNNRYSIFAEDGYRMYYIGEHSREKHVTLYKARRAFLINVYDCFGRIVFVLKREMGCMAWYWGPRCYGERIVVTLNATGNAIGSVKQGCTCRTPGASVYNEEGKAIFRIRGPGWGTYCHRCVMPANAQFHIQDVQSKKFVGIIKRNAVVQEFTEAGGENYVCEVEPGMNVKKKALLVAAMFSIDFGYFKDPATGCCRGGTNGFECTVLILIIAGVFLVVIVIVVDTNKT